MSALLSEYAQGRDNNFNLMRFIAAILVLFSHSFSLVTGSSDSEPLKSTLGMTWGMIAVDVFFITSGFLITASFFARNNLIAFIWARVLRIFPGLLVALLFCVFVVGALFTSLSPSQYLTELSVYKYLIKNFVLFFGIDHSLPGVFESLPYERAVNGSLWTLPYEVRMYALLAITMSLTLYVSSKVSWLTPRLVLTTLSVLAVGLHIANYFESFLPRKFIHLFSMFFMGATFYVWREKIVISHKWLFALTPLLIVSILSKEIFFVVYSLIITPLTLYLAYVPSGVIRKFNQYGDYSYGLYIYAFPIQQSLMYLIPELSISGMIFGSFFVTSIFAYLSWHLIEKRSLKLKNAFNRPLPR